MTVLNPSSSTGAVASVFGRTGAVVKAGGDYAVADVTGAAPLASPALTGTPTVPTAGASTSNTQAASTAYADAAVLVEKNRALAAETTETVNTVASSGATQTIPDVTTATIHQITLSANCTFTFPTAAAGKSFSLALKQDGTGSRTATWPSSATLLWPGGTAPTLTTAINKTDLLSFVCADGTHWLGVVAAQNF